MIFRKLDVLWAWFVRIITNLLPDSECCMRLRARLYSLAAKKIGKRVRIASDVRFTKIHNMTIGDDVYIAPNCVFLLAGNIELEDKVVVEHKVLFATTNHLYVNGSYRNLNTEPKPILVKRGARLGMHSVVLPGATVGEGTYVEPLSAVAKELPPNAHCGGTPARVIEYFEQNDADNSSDNKKQN